MVDAEINKTLRQFFISARAERKDTLQNNISIALGNLQSRNMVNSSVAVNEISMVYAEELKLRSLAAWESIKKFFEKGNITFNKNDAKEIEELLKQHIINEEKNLSREVKSRFMQKLGPLDFKNSILVAVDTHGLTPVALAAEDHFISFEGFRTLKLPRKERFHLRAHARSPQLILDSLFKKYNISKDICRTKFLYRFKIN